MVSCTVSLREATRLRTRSFVGRDGLAVAWLEIEDDGLVAVYGTAGELRGLAAAAGAAADEADALLPRAAADGAGRRADEHGRDARAGAGV